MLRFSERFGFLHSGKSSERLNRLIQQLHPEDTGIPLIRMGEAHDGGYLVPDDLGSLAALFSPGVAQTSAFEADALARGM